MTFQSRVDSRCELHPQPKMVTSRRPGSLWPMLRPPRRIRVKPWSQLHRRGPGDQVAVSLQTPEAILRELQRRPAEGPSMKAHLRNRAEDGVVLKAVDQRLAGQRGRMRWGCPLRNAGNTLRWIAKDVGDDIPAAPRATVAGASPNQVHMVLVLGSRRQASADVSIRPAARMHTWNETQLVTGLNAAVSPLVASIHVDFSSDSVRLATWLLCAT